MIAQAGIRETAALFRVSDWVQGEPVNLDQLTGRVVLLEVFQVNCPGCFLYALPEAVDLHKRYAQQGLTVIGIATAFEDFDKNTLGNLQLLADTGEVIGETLTKLTEQGFLVEGKLPYRIPFPLAMDRLVKREVSVNEEEITEFIQEHFPNFAELAVQTQQITRENIRAYLAQLEFHAETFERYRLKGTPSQILIDKQGVPREVNFGFHPNLEGHVLKLLGEV